MACTLSNSGIATGLVIRAAQVSQSIDAFTKAKAYDITLSGSLVVQIYLKIIYYLIPAIPELYLL